MSQSLISHGQTCLRGCVRSIFPVMVLSLLAVAPLSAASYNWNIVDDPYTASDIDMRGLNEQTAGQSGWVTYKDDGNFYTGDGKLLRFWGYTGSAAESTFAKQQQRAQFLAKRGINLQRWHNSVYSNSANTLEAVNMNLVDGLQKAVSANKQQGIYTEISDFFILGLKMQPEWGIDGYTSEWMAANPVNAVRAPFGLQFFDEKFKAAMKTWIEVILTTPNPYETDQHPLKDDPAIAYIELQNEDNLFFYTFVPSSFPPEQQQKIYKKFGDFLIAKYGSITAAQAAWGGGALAGDDPNAGIMVVTDASSVAGTGGSSASDKRKADLLEFYTKTQYDFYAELSQHLRDLGYGGVIGGSNWHTADIKNLYDIELYTYTAAGVTDSHNYYGTYEYQGTNAAGTGDVFVSVPTVANPRSGSVALKTVEGHPHVISEVAWVNPSNYSSEGPLVAAAYSSMRSYDGWVWFAYSGTTWSSLYETWPMGKPSVLGQFPGAALLYRRGDVDVASTLVREGRLPQTMTSRQKNIISSNVKWRLTDDPTTRFNYNPSTGSGEVDNAAMLAGGVDLAFDTDEDFVSDKLSTLIDNTKKTITSATGQLVMDSTAKILTINSPRSQAAVGFLKNKSDITLDDVIIRAGPSFNFGSILVISLDGLPIGQSAKLLIQSGMQDNLTGYQTDPTTLAGLPAEKIISVGQLPWTVEQVDARVTLRGKIAGDVLKIQPLNENGYPAGAPVAATETPQGMRFTLPTSVMYTVVTLNPVANATPVITTRNLPNSKRGNDYAAQLQAVSGDGDLTWSVTEGSSLPSGLTLSTSGLLSGKVNTGNTDSFNVTVTDKDGDSASQDLFLITLPYGSSSLLNTEGVTYRFGDFVWNEKLDFLYDGFYPFVYSFKYEGWIYLFDGPGVTETDGYYLYDFSKEQFGFTKASYYPWYFVVGGPNDNQTVDLSMSSTQ